MVSADILNRGGPSRRSNPESESFLIFSLRCCPEPGEACCLSRFRGKSMYLHKLQGLVHRPAVPLHFLYLSHLSITYLLTVVLVARSPWAAGPGNAWVDLAQRDPTRAMAATKPRAARRLLTTGKLNFPSRWLRAQKEQDPHWK